MLLNKVRIVFAGVLGVSLLSTGAVVLARQKAEHNETKQDADAKSVDSTRKDSRSKDQDLSRTEKLGEEADELTAQIEILQFELESLKQHVQSSYPQPASEFGMGMGMMGGGMGGMGGAGMGGFAGGVKPDADDEDAKKTLKESKKKREEFIERRVKHYEGIKKDFLSKSVKLGGMRRRLATINAELAKSGGAADAEKKSATVLDPELKQRLAAIERKVDEILTKIDPKDR